MAISYASSTLTLTGGTTSSRLTPANVINDAAAFSTGSTYAIGVIVQHNAGGGLGTALYRCSTAVTVAGAFNPANWTLVAYIQGTNSLWLETSLVISAAYNDNGWAYSFASGLIFAGTGCDWVSGSALNSSYNIGFTVTYTGSGLPEGEVNILTGTTGVVNWANVRFICPPGQNKGVGLISSTMTGSIINCYFTNAINQSINAPLIVKSNISSIFVNLSVNPVNLFGLVHSGLYEGGFVDNKFGVLTATQSGSVVSGTRYIVAALGTATLAQWQSLFNTLTALPVVGDVLSATTTGTLAGSAQVKQYRAISRYTPDIPANNSRGIGIIAPDSLQFFEDLVVTAGFNFANQIRAFFGGTSVYFTRQVNMVAKQGANLLSGVNVRVVNTSNDSQLSVETTDSNGAINKQMLIFSGERVGGGSYLPLQNAKDYRNKSFLFRRKDLEEATYTADMTISGVELTQFMSTDAYYTTDQSANITDVSFATTGSNITSMTINADMTLDRLWDIAKAYFEVNMGIVNPFTASGKNFNLGAVSVSRADRLSAGAKLDSVVTTGAVTGVGTITVGIEDSAGVRVTVRKSGGGNFNIAARYGSGSTYTDLGYQADVSTITYTVPKGQPVEVVMWALGYVTYSRLISTVNGGVVFDAEMTLNESINTALDVSPYLPNIALSLDTSGASPVFVITFNAPMTISGIELGKAVIHRLVGQEIALKAGFPPGSTATIVINSDEITNQLPAARLALGAGLSVTDRVYLDFFINTAQALAINPAYVINPPRADGNQVVILRAKPALDASVMALAVRQEIERTGGMLDGKASQASVTALATAAQVTALGAPLQASSYTAPPSATSTAQAVRAELATELGRMDASVSSRLATAAYTTPPSAAEIATQVEIAIINEDDGRQVIEAIADKIKAEEVTAGVIAATVRTEIKPDLQIINTGVKKASLGVPHGLDLPS